jgi:hypothetical protein
MPCRLQKAAGRLRKPLAVLAVSSPTPLHSRRPAIRKTPTPAGRLIVKSLRRGLGRLSAALPVDEGGGSSLLKVMVLADLIVALDLCQVVEIGVYRGRLLLPPAMVMAALVRGKVVGIDPYSAEAAVQRDDHDVGFDLAASAPPRRLGRAASWPPQRDR